MGGWSPSQAVGLIFSPAKSYVFRKLAAGCYTQFESMYFTSRSPIHVRAGDTCRVNVKLGLLDEFVLGPRM